MHITVIADRRDYRSTQGVGARERERARAGGNETREQAIEKALAQKRVRCARASDYTAIHFQFQIAIVVFNSLPTQPHSLRVPSLPPCFHNPFINLWANQMCHNQSTDTQAKFAVCFDCAALRCAAAAETNMPLITVSISDRDSRLAVKNASQDMALCALCNASSSSSGNPTYVQYFFYFFLFLLLSSIVCRDSPQQQQQRL